MNRVEKLRFLCTMLHDNYGLWSWKLDRNLELIGSNCEYGEYSGELVMNRSVKEILQETFPRSRVPMIAGETNGSVWGAVCEQETGEIIVLGPLFYRPVSADNIQETMKAENKPDVEPERIESWLAKVPVVPHEIFRELLRMVYSCVNEEVIRASEFTYHSSQGSGSEREVGKRKEKKDAEGHSPLINEKLLLDMVRTGNLDYNRALDIAGAASPGIRTEGVNPLRQGKYSVVAFTTLCSRAAIEGGLSSDIAYSLSDKYVQMVDACRTMSEAAVVSHAMYDEYIHRVNRCRSASGLSRPVIACCDYIDTHPAEKITVEQLGNRAGYADYYFSRMFKKETGMSVKEYIQKARMREAKTLLASSDMNIQQISDHLHFCSRSYFADQFHKSEGMTPAEYRAKNRDQ